MRIAVGGRACGKTTRAIEWLLEDSNRKLAVFSEREKQRIVKHFNISELKILVWNRQHPDNHLNCELGVDNAEWIIQEYFKNSVSKVWMTGEYENLPLFKESE